MTCHGARDNYDTPSGRWDEINTGSKTSSKCTFPVRWCSERVGVPVSRLRINLNSNRAAESPCWFAAYLSQLSVRFITGSFLNSFLLASPLRRQNILLFSFSYKLSLIRKRTRWPCLYRSASPTFDSLSFSCTRLSFCHNSSY